MISMNIENLNQHKIYDMFESENKNMYGPVSLKFPLLFDITANKRPNIDIDSLIINAYNYYKEIYNINLTENISNLIKNNDFKKDTQIIYITIHHNAEHKLKEIEDIIQINLLYKNIFESHLYELHNLSDLSDKLVEQIYKVNIDEIQYIICLFKQIDTLVYKYN